MAADEAKKCAHPVYVHAKEQQVLQPAVRSHGTHAGY